MSNTCCGTIKVDDNSLFWVDNCLTNSNQRPQNIIEAPCGGVFINADIFKFIGGVLTLVTTNEVNNIIPLCASFKADGNVFAKDGGVWTIALVSEDPWEGIETTTETIGDVEYTVLPTQTFTGAYDKPMVWWEFNFPVGVVPYAGISWENLYDGVSGSDGFFEIEVSTVTQEVNGYTVSYPTGYRLRCISNSQIPNQEYTFTMILTDVNGDMVGFKKTFITDFDDTYVPD